MHPNSWLLWEDLFYGTFHHAFWVLHNRTMWLPSTCDLKTSPKETRHAHRNLVSYLELQHRYFSLLFLPSFHVFENKSAESTSDDEESYSAGNLPGSVDFRVQTRLRYSAEGFLNSLHFLHKFYLSTAHTTVGIPDICNFHDTKYVKRNNLKEIPLNRTCSKTQHFHINRNIHPYRPNPFSFSFHLMTNTGISVQNRILLRSAVGYFDDLLALCKRLTNYRIRNATNHINKNIRQYFAMCAPP